MAYYIAGNCLHIIAVCMTRYNSKHMAIGENSSLLNYDVTLRICQL